MTSVKDLEINVPLGNLQAVKIGSYVNVSQYKKLSIAFYSDCALTLTFTASYNSVKAGPTNTYVTHPNIWETATIPIFLPYIKLDFEKIDPNAPNNELIVVINGHIKRMQKGESSIEEKQEKPAKRRWSSILHSSPKLKEKEEASPSSNQKEPSISSKDFPGLILPNTLFVGGRGNKIIALPPGTPGQILQFTEFGIAWV